MTALTKPRYSPEEYLARERAAEVRHEFYRGKMYLMTRVSEAHNLISGNVGFALREKLRGQGCRAYTNDMRVLVSENGLYCPVKS